MHNTLSFEIKEFLLKIGAESQYIYHLVPNQMKGKILYPLSQLEEKEPLIYKKEIKKYKDRTNIPNRKIDLLNCKWKDCLIFSTINPEKLIDLHKLLGMKYDTIKYYQININNLKSKEFVIYDDANNTYKKTSMENYKEEKNISVGTALHYAESKEKNEYPLFFGGVKHLLLKDSLNISNFKIIEIK